MAKRRRFQRTLSAVTSTRPTQGGIGDALRADVRADLEAGGEPIPGVGYFEECEVFLRFKGHIYDAAYLRQLYRASAITAREEWSRNQDQLDDRRRFVRGKLS